TTHLSSTMWLPPNRTWLQDEPVLASGPPCGESDRQSGGVYAAGRDPNLLVRGPSCHYRSSSGSAVWLAGRPARRCAGYFRFEAGGPPDSVQPRLVKTGMKR